MTVADDLLVEIERLRDVIQTWGLVLIAEGRITLDDYWAAMGGYVSIAGLAVYVGDPRPDGRVNELARIHRRLSPDF